VLHRWAVERGHRPGVAAPTLLGPVPDRAQTAAMDDDVCEVIITAPDAAWLARFVRTLVEGRTAACGHTIETVRSTYRWAGAVEEATEARVALHTRRSLVPEIRRLVDAEHPYDVPCLLVVPVVDGSPAYLSWVLDETNPG
jgi:periplasmic divalent cation tolerance protein